MTDSAITVHHGEIEPSREIAAAPDTATSNPMQLLAGAISQGASPESLERLMAMQERWEANQARKAFDAAMSAAKAEIPVIVKNRMVGYENRDGKSSTSYSHEDLGEIARTVDPILSKHGLSYRFQTTSEINQPIEVTCIVAHRDGHSERNTLKAGRDDSGKKNAIQQMGSTITYLQRYTLKAALGLAAARDDDGKASGSAEDFISDEQLDTLQTLIRETETRIGEFLMAIGFESLSDIPTTKFDEVLAKLEKKKRLLAERRSKETSDA